MAFVEQAQVNDIGTVFRVTVYDTTNTGSTTVADISDATVLKFYFLTPEDSKKERTASFVNDGTDGLIQYTTVDGDLSCEGTWSLQAYVETPGGKWHTNSANFKVYENL